MTRYYNCEKYSDPTAGMAIGNVTRDEKKLKQKAEYERFKSMLKDIHTLCMERGFTLENHIWLKDERTGKVWR